MKIWTPPTVRKPLVFDETFFDAKNNIFKYSSEEDEFGDDFTCLWDEVGSWMAKNSLEGNCFKVSWHNMWWQNRSGEKYMQVTKWEDLVRGLLPNTSELSIEAYVEWATIWFKVFHHDSPTWEYYIVKPVTEKEYDANN